MLKGKKIILGITGSIAAYKAAYLVRLLIKSGAGVKVIMTPFAKEFITPLTLSTLSGNPVLVDMFEQKSGDWTSHVDLGLWADLLLIAPATANTLSKMASGRADNLLLAVYLSARCPVMVAPAMDLDMFQHPATQKNLKTLESFGNLILDTGTGELASGLTGKGRLEEPGAIVKKVSEVLNEKSKKKNQARPLKNKKVLVTAGPTYEIIDPVRFIGNFSSGKMGLALVEALTRMGAEVHLVLGPVAGQTVQGNARVYNVISAREMYETCIRIFPEMDGAIMTAAVSDFTPLKRESQKTKRTGGSLSVELKPTKDIAAALGQMKTTKQWLVGFALETRDELENARKKLKSKNLDLIVLNSLNDPGAGFGYDTNKITIVSKEGSVNRYPLKSKSEVAQDISEVISTLA